MLLSYLFTDPFGFIGFVTALIASISIHEFAHALMATWQGDPTPKSEGRLTLNPFAHLDLLGSIFLLLAGFGWGKPVMINPRNFTNSKIGEVIVALAGPFSNVLFAFLLAITLRWFNLPSNLSMFLLVIMEVNLLLAVFNFLPVPPLDGSKLIRLFVSEETHLSLQRYGITILFALLLFSAWIYPILPRLITAVLTFLNQILLGTNVLPF